MVKFQIDLYSMYGWLLFWHYRGKHYLMYTERANIKP